MRACVRACACLVGDVVDHDGGLRSTVIHGRQAVVTLLARRVPDLKLHGGVIQTDGLGQERSWRRSDKKVRSTKTGERIKKGGYR